MNCQQIFILLLDLFRDIHQKILASSTSFFQMIMLIDYTICLMIQVVIDFGIALVF